MSLGEVLRVRNGHGDNVPLGLSHVSHSACRFIRSPISKTTTLRRNATASHPRRQARPRTLSLNSSSATSLPMASSHRITLFGGYSGLRPPPRRNNRDDVCNGMTEARVPPESSDQKCQEANATFRDKTARYLACESA